MTIYDHLWPFNHHLWFLFGPFRFIGLFKVLFKNGACIYERICLEEKLTEEQMVQRDFENRAKQLLINRVIKGFPKKIARNRNDFYFSENLWYPVNFESVELSSIEFRSILENKIDDSIYAKVCTGRVIIKSFKK